MRQLTEMEFKQVEGGFHLNIGTAVFAVAGGFIFGGPVGALAAVGAVIGAQGINNLHEMYQNEFGARR